MYFFVYIFLKIKIKKLSTVIMQKILQCVFMRGIINLHVVITRSITIKWSIITED